LALAFGTSGKKARWIGNKRISCINKLQTKRIINLSSGSNQPKGKFYVN